MRWAGYVACKREQRKVDKVLVGKPTEKIPLGILKHKWEDGIKMDFGEIGWGSVDSPASG
jgi:hypothetical protein